MNNWIVYKHISPYGKVYVGITSRDISKRWRNAGKGYLNKRKEEHILIDILLTPL